MGYHEKGRIMKTCTKCLVKYEDNNFSTSKKYKDGLKSWCISCNKVYMKQYYLEHKIGITNKVHDWVRDNREQKRKHSLSYARRNPEKLKNRSLLNKYGITLDDFKAMKEKQNNICIGCRKPETAIHNITKQVRELAVDHCHTTGKVRGLLCSRCNIILGLSSESCETLKNLIDYLKKGE